MKTDDRVETLGHPFGVFLMLPGVALPFLMVIQLLESTFFLNFLSWGASVAGLAFGTIGFAMCTRGKRN